MINSNVRVQKTKENLKLALLKLLLHKKLNEITVKELCDTAKIQRGTFYRHYANIIELHTEITNENITEVTNYFSLDTPFSLKIANIKKGLNYIKEKEVFLFIAYKKPSEFNTFNSTFKNLCIKKIARILNTDLSNPECFFTISFMYAGIYEYIFQWVTSNYATPVDDAAQHIYTLIKGLTDTLPVE